MTILIYLGNFIAISPKGMTNPFFHELGLDINGFVYCNECLNSYLFFFIKNYNRNVFWPDLASAYKPLID